MAGNVGKVSTTVSSSSLFCISSVYVLKQVHDEQRAAPIFVGLSLPSKFGTPISGQTWEFFEFGPVQPSSVIVTVVMLASVKVESCNISGSSELSIHVRLELVVTSMAFAYRPLTVEFVLTSR